MTCSKPNINDLRAVVYDIVSQIPAGRVLTYGHIASLAGWPNHSRLVGRIMRMAPDESLPCHRVVNASGRLAPHYPSQAALLFDEGVVLSATGKVSLKQYLWRADEEC
ncbi:MAG: MGMT family protein [Bacteroidales bacterium]|nr:MGMT family protein [Bacteroidales bacterium]